MNLRRVFEGLLLFSVAILVGMSLFIHLNYPQSFISPPPPSPFSSVSPASSLSSAFPPSPRKTLSEKSEIIPEEGKDSTSPNQAYAHNPGSNQGLLIPDSNQGGRDPGLNQARVNPGLNHGLNHDSVARIEQTVIQQPNTPQSGGHFHMGPCPHPSYQLSTRTNYHTVGESQPTLRRRFGVAAELLNPWLSIYFCDPPKPSSLTITFNIFLSRGAQIKFLTLEGRVHYYIAFFRSLKYIVQQHQNEDFEWVKSQEKGFIFNEKFHQLTIQFSQDPNIAEGSPRTNTVSVKLGRYSYRFQFQTTYSLSVIQELQVDCVSHSFTCSEITQISFDGLQQNPLFKLSNFLPPYIEAIQKVKDLPSFESSNFDQNGPRVLLGILTNPSSFELRMAQRQTWGKHPLVTSGKIVVRYFAGTPTSDFFNQVMELENEAFRDIVIQRELGEFYLTIGNKVYYLLSYFSQPEWMDTTIPTFLAKSDDDMYIDMEKFYTMVIQNSHNLDRLVIISQWVKKKPHLNWYYNTYDDCEYEGGTITHPIGMFYMLSKPLLEGLMKEEREKALLSFHALEDVQMARWIDHFEMEGNRVERVTITGLADTCKPASMIAHHLLPRQIRCAHKGVLINRAITCCD